MKDSKDFFNLLKLQKLNLVFRVIYLNIENNFKKTNGLYSIEK